ncbi:MAG: ATP-binding protein [Nitrosopumilus sp.]|nr:ATP-binding protein [Nitrosopumilus sp.]MDA7990501.1 ATP-binding protein [Gammaproteobacteria bacterium]
MATQQILPIKIGAALKSLANNDFDAYSAIYEVIDNSIQAESKEIKIRFEVNTPRRKHKPRPVRIAFGDDGHGMDPKTLQHCLAIGYSNRYGDRKGIGRFGVGMTMGAINICDKIEVYSRPKQGNWNYTFLDISGIDNDEDPSLHPIEQRDLPSEYKDLVGDMGTLIIWTKIERIDPEFDIDELKHKIGRIYRKFIGEEIIVNSKIKKNTNIRKIFVHDGTNNELVSAHDPLYAVRNSKFPEDKRATLQPEHTFEHPVHEVDSPKSGEKTGMITIRTSLLPATWRKGQRNAHLKGYGGSSKHNNERRVMENEGVSILRNGREVYYGTISRFSPATKPSDRFWGCEIDFEPVLDHWFSVRNIKIGARPLKELRDELQKKLGPTILNKFRKNIEESWADDEQKESESETGPIKSHVSTEKAIAGNIPPLQSTNTPEEIDENTKKHAEALFDDSKDQKEYIDAIKDPDTLYKIIHDHKARSDGPFIDVLDDVGKKVVHYNMSHPFFVEIYRRLGEIEAISKDPQNDELRELAKSLKSDIDKLIYAYAEGQYDLDDLTRTQSVRDTVEEHLMKWSYHLRKTYKT